MIDGRTTERYTRSLGSSRMERSWGCRTGRFWSGSLQKATKRLLKHRFTSWADGSASLPPAPGGSSRWRRRVPGRVPGPGSQGAVDSGRGVVRAVALHGRDPGGRPRPGQAHPAGAREPSGRELPHSPCRDDLDGFEIHRVVHEELCRLPERLRAPLVLCYLEGMTHDLAARQLGCPVGTVRSRLARARDLLKRRLSRRGLAVAAAALGSLLESSAKAAANSPALPNSLINLVTRAVSGSLHQGGSGAFRSISALLEGVMNVSQIKKMAILAAAGLSIGALVFVVTARSNVAGQTAPGVAQPGVREVDDRTLGPDGRPVGPAPGTSKTAMITKTYYVGDLILAPEQRGIFAPGSMLRKDFVTQPDPTSLTPGSTKPATNVRPVLNYTPLIELIEQTIAPGTWTVLDQSGQPVPSQLNDGRNSPPGQASTITPFLLSISLIIKSTPEVHEKTSILLRGLRALLNSRDASGGNFEVERATSPAAASRPNTPVPSADEATRRITIDGPVTIRDGEIVAHGQGMMIQLRNTESRTKIERLLDELRDEVKKLDRVPAETSPKKD